jgi:hypothetical protein
MAVACTVGIEQDAVDVEGEDGHRRSLADQLDRAAPLRSAM